MRETTFYYRHSSEANAVMAEIMRVLINLDAEGSSGAMCWKIEISPDTEGKPRTQTQNNCMWLWAQLCANALNNAGYDQRAVLSEEIELPWTKYSFIENVWRRVQQALTGKESTTKASTIDYPLISDTITRHIAMKVGVTLPPWPDRFGGNDGSN